MWKLAKKSRSEERKPKNKNVLYLFGNISFMNENYYVDRLAFHARKFYAMKFVWLELERALKK